MLISILEISSLWYYKAYDAFFTNAKYLRLNDLINIYLFLIENMVKHI